MDVEHMHETSSSAGATGFIVLGDQLFPPAALNAYAGCPVFMAEDRRLCSRLRYHQQKLVLILAAMREHADALRKRGFAIRYHRLEETGDEPYFDRLNDFVRQQGLTQLAHFEVENREFEAQLEAFCRGHSLQQTVLPSPMFVTPRGVFTEYLASVKRPFMAEFYKRQRRRLGILVDATGKPAGGQWSFDADNRRKLPATVALPEPLEVRWSAHTKAVVTLVGKHFADHPGSAQQFWWPTTRRAALRWLQAFLDHRLEYFGAYQDAISQRSETAFHSTLSPLINIGLITPREIIERTLAHAAAHDVPINSLEGFLRQIIGWREFIRGIYQHFDAQQREANFFEHRRTLTSAWYCGDTGIPPLDDAIKSALRLGWTHHINRLMVVANLMNLCEIEPRQVYGWFMQTHVDSADWVMGPNVYGMGLFSDGGVFATKPYLCGSNYLLKMSDYRKGEWCDTVDGIYWRFIERHRDYFTSNPRLSMMARMLDRLAPARRETIFAAAEVFLARHTLLATER